MTNQAIYNLTSGSIDGTFDQAVLSIQNHGFRQSVFEVERLISKKSGKLTELIADEVYVLRPSSTPPQYSLMKPGDQVSCVGIKRDASGEPSLCRIRRMAEGYSRNSMTERV